MDTNLPEIAAQMEYLYNTVIQSFNFHPEGNLCLDCQEDDGETTSQKPQIAIISGWLQHDLCQSGRDGELQPVTTPSGCVKNDSLLDQYHAIGEFALSEPVIKGVVVSFSQGDFQSTGFAEKTTIFSFLRPAMWTCPNITEEII